MKNFKSCVFLALIMLFSAGGAEAEWTREYGGSGGANFLWGCQSTEHIRQFDVRSGTLLDGLRSVCNAGENPLQDHVSGWVGGFGGSPSTLSCGKYMVGARFYYGTYVNSFQVTCRQQLVENATTTLSAQVGTKTGTFTGYNCSKGMALTGFRGGAGTLIDRLSVLCEKRGPL